MGSVLDRFGQEAVAKTLLGAKGVEVITQGPVKERTQLSVT